MAANNVGRSRPDSMVQAGNNEKIRQLEKNVACLDKFGGSDGLDC